MTRNTSPREIHGTKAFHESGPPCTAESTSGGRSASTTAPIVTIGVYTRAKLEISRSVFALRSCACSTNCSILAAAVFSAATVVLITASPSVLTNPASTVPSTSIKRGTLSPVIEEVSKEHAPSTSIPSSGTFSPGFTRISVPIGTSSGATMSGSSPS